MDGVESTCTLGGRLLFGGRRQAHLGSAHGTVKWQLPKDAVPLRASSFSTENAGRPHVSCLASHNFTKSCGKLSCCKRSHTTLRIYYANIRRDFTSVFCILVLTRIFSKKSFYGYRSWPLPVLRGQFQVLYSAYNSPLAYLQINVVRALAAKHLVYQKASN